MKDQNIRKENKLYSYKEQMADLELRKVGEKVCQIKVIRPDYQTKKQILLIPGTDS